MGNAYQLHNSLTLAGLVQPIVIAERRLHAVRLAVVLLFSSPFTIIGRRAVIQPIERCQCDAVQQKIEVVNLKQAFPGPEVWQVLFTILTGSGNMV